MRIPRFYTPQIITVDDTLDLPTELIHYMHNVLHLKVGTPIVLFNGNGIDYPSELLEISKRNAKVLINAQINISNESSLQLHLAQGVSKGDRMDIALQKAVELGVTAITPLITENCNVKLDAQRWEKKAVSWQKLIIAACEQCQRNVVPTLNKPLTLHQWIGKSIDLEKIILAPGAKKYLSSLDKPQKGFSLIVGPEGGLSEKEVYTATENGYTQVNIGSRILRTETAAIASIAILQSKFGDL